MVIAISAAGIGIGLFALIAALAMTGSVLLSLAAYAAVGALAAGGIAFCVIRRAGTDNSP